MPQFRGPVETDEFVDVAKSRGLSQERIRKRFIRYRYVTESAFFAIPAPIAAPTFVIYPIQGGGFFPS